MGKILRTPQAKTDYKKIFKERAKRFGEKVAHTTLKQIEEAEQRILDNPLRGRLEPEFHSDKYRFIQTRNRQKIFYTTKGEDVIIITAGYDGRDWGKILREIKLKFLFY